MPLLCLFGALNIDVMVFWDPANVDVVVSKQCRYYGFWGQSVLVMWLSGSVCVDVMVADGK